MTNGNSLARHIPGIDGKSSSLWPAHRGPIAEHSRFGIIWDLIHASALLDGSLSVGKNIHAGRLVSANFLARQSEEIPSQINGGLPPTNSLTNKFRRGHVVKLVRIHFHDPVAVLVPVTALSKQIAADGLTVDDRFTEERNHATVLRRIFPDNLPCRVRAPQIHDVNRIYPREQGVKTLGQNVLFIANQHQSMKPHVYFVFSVVQADSSGKSTERQHWKSH